MHSDQTHKYIEAKDMNPAASWEKISDATEVITGDGADYFKLAGKIPDTGISRSSVYRTPETRLDFEGRGLHVNRALEINVPASDLGEISCLKWKSCTSPAEQLEIGMELLRTFARSSGGFTDLQAIFTEHDSKVTKMTTASAQIGVDATPSGSFADARLKIWIRYHTETSLLPVLQIDSWLSNLGKYLNERGLTETLIGMLGEGKSLEDVLQDGNRELPFPSDIQAKASFFTLLPETLRLRKRIHGNHPQLELGTYRSQVRVPLGREVEPEISPILNQSRLAIELARHNFAISYCDGLADWMPDAGSSRNDEPRVIADLLPGGRRDDEFSGAGFGKSERNAANYYGPYLHIMANHDNSEERRDALAGILLMIYNAREFISGLSTLFPKHEEE